MKQLAIVCAAIITCVAATIAQTRPLPAQAPVFRSGVEYVTLDVVVTDKKDRPVRDLTKDDFEIVEGGKSQTILEFQHVDVPVTRRVVDLKAQPIVPDVIENAKPAPNARAFVFVIDDGTVQPADIIPLKRAMAEFLATLTPDDVAAMVYIKRSDLAQDFTKDLGSLIRGVQNINSAVGWAPDAKATRNVLENVVTSLASVPYTRKVIVYVSGGFQIDYTNTTPYTHDGVWLMSDVQLVFERARRANTPIYTLDPHGLGIPDELGFQGHMENQTGDKVRLARHTASKNADFLKSFALNTGGLSYVQTSNIGAAVDTIMGDNASYYVIGFSPAPYSADGKYHSVDVRVKTRSGLSVRARQGYVAAAAIPGPGGAAPEALSAALSGSVPYSDLSLRAVVAPMTSAPKGVRSAIVLDVTYPAVADRGGAVDDELRVQFAVVDTDGAVLKEQQRNIRVPWTGVPVEPFHVRLDDAVDLPTGKGTLRIGVSSRALGKVGTLHVPVDVRDVSGSRLELSPLVIGTTTAGPAVLVNPETIANLVPFQPTTDRDFTRDQTLQLFSRLFGVADNVAVEVALERGDKSVRTVRMIAATDSPRDLQAELTLRDQSPGAYVLVLTAKPAKGDAFVRAVPIRIK